MGSGVLFCTRLVLSFLLFAVHFKEGGYLDSGKGVNFFRGCSVKGCEG